MSTTFTYKARDPLGNVVDGIVNAVDSDRATDSLRRDGFDILEIDAQADGDGFDLFAKPIRKTDIIYLTGQLSIMVDTGISLSAALGGLLEQEENPTLKKVLEDIKGSIESGEDFSAALARYPKHFSMTYVALVKASEQTGTLGTMLDRIAGYMRTEVESGSKVRAALAYPAIMMILAVGVTVFLLTYIMPQFEPLFAQRGDSLPVSTKGMMWLSASMLGYWYLWILGVGAAAAGYYFFQRTAVGRMIIDRVKINLPVIGPMMRKVTISRSIRTLGTMIHSGVDVLDALQLSANVAGNYHYEKLWSSVVQKVTTGHQICEALAGNTLLPATLIQMIGSGEETGKLDVVLNKVSNYYDREVETTLKGVTSIIEPIMITAMGVIIGTIALSLLLPIFQLSRPV